MPVYLGLGDKEKTLDWLEECYEERALFVTSRAPRDTTASAVAERMLQVIDPDEADAGARRVPARIRSLIRGKTYRELRADGLRLPVLSHSQAARCPKALLS